MQVCANQNARNILEPRNDAQLNVKTESQFQII